MTAARRRLAAALLAGALALLTACEGGRVADPKTSPPPSAPGAGKGVAALHPAAGSVPEVLRLIDQTGDTTCRSTPSPQTGPPRHFDVTVNQLLAGYLKEWAVCGGGEASGNSLIVMIFKPETLPTFEKAWRDYIVSNQNADPPDLAFGKGFAISARDALIKQLGLYYLRCGDQQPAGSDTVPSDTEGCVFVSTK